MSDASKPRLAFLHEATYSPEQRIHMIVLIEDILEASGVEVVHLASTDQYIQADLLFVHVDRSIVSSETCSFALHYPNAVNAYATDIRKARYIDGLLGRNDAHDGPVIVKTDLNYAGQPERNSQNRVRTIPRRLIARAMRLLGATDYTIRTKSDYRIYDSLAEVPRHYFGDDYVVQKFMPERDGAKNVLREYIFLGDLHYENIERSSDLIITEDEHVSCKSCHTRACSRFAGSWACNMARSTIRWSMASLSSSTQTRLSAWVNMATRPGWHPTFTVCWLASLEN